MSVDTIRAVFTNVIALFVIVGGLVFLWRAMDLAAEKRDQLILGAVIALMGGAAQFVFQSETSTRSARQTERATQQGLDTPTVPTEAT